jgi:protein phosphatase
MVLASIPPDEAAQTLVDLANLLGGPDNITAIVVEVADPALLGQKNGKSWQDAAQIPARGTIEIALGDWRFIAISAIAAAAGAILAAKDYWSASAVCIVIAACVFASWAYRRLANRDSQHCKRVNGHHGKAPYRSYSVAPSAQNIEMLSDIVRQLEDLEAQRSWPFDWKGVHADRHAAHKAIAAGDYMAAVVAYSSAVRRLMQAVRAGRPDPPSDSGIQLGRD